MAMYVVLGDGELTQKELTETLQDLWRKSGDAPFWFVVQGKSAPTATDKVLVTWLRKNDIWYEVITDDADALDALYKGYQEVHVVKRLGQKIVNLLTTKPEEDEEACILALFTVTDPAAEEDRWLNLIVEQAVKAGFKAYSLTDGLLELEVSSTPSDTTTQEPEGQDDVPTKTPSKRVAKQAAAKSKSYTRDELEEMDLGQLKEIAVANGITLPPKTRPKTYIDHILGEAKPDAPIAEVTIPPVTRTMTADEPDEPDFNGMVEQVTAAVIERLISALSN